ncbi:hypothetical protein DFR52_102445 [Hoeflea marina]|uniref:Polysaccharide deacetylase n=1 Tax=Hoeflea marina TaxID=274592 RepID=A0A317PNE2_9HYPH|nr:hypothetical protein DFR52_102445 [Hoeflea marina]
MSVSRLPATLTLAMALAASLAAPAGAGDARPAPARPEQLVIISFDGAHDNRLWERSLALGDRTGARFTYFLSCTFLMTKAHSKAYQAPGKSAGRSNVGFAPDRADVAARLGHIWAAYQAGHEIGSHGCGHFDGKDWSKAQWQTEFASFRAALGNAWADHGLAAASPAGWADFADRAVRGFRAPYLSADSGLYAALAADGFAYDASGVSRGPAAPDTGGRVARFSLPLIPEGPAGRPVIGMDYNLFARHSRAVETPDTSGDFEARALAAFRNAFEKQYQGTRIPLQLGFHFVEMNGGAYWRALERFATETCGKPEVECVSYQDAMKRLRSPDDSAS